MTQQGIDRDFTYLSIQDNQQPRKLPPALQPRSRTGQSPIPSQQTQPQQQIYRAVPAVYKASYRAPDDDLPPPPLPKVLGGYPDDDYLPPPPPPPLDMRASHRFIDQNDSYPPPPPLQPSLEYMPQEVNVRTTSTGHSVQTSYGAPASSYDSRADYVTATTGYDSRNVQQQPTYANQADVRATARQPVGVAPGGGTKNYVNINIPPSQSYGAPNPSAPLQYMRPGSVSPSGYRNQTRSPQLDSHHPHPPPPPPPPPPISKLPEQTSLSRSDKAGKEAEVDALTNLLMQNMESVGDPDFFGICAKCGRKVIGESSGCTAMDQVFHISCFICASCELNETFNEEQDKTLYFSWKKYLQMLGCLKLCGGSLPQEFDFESMKLYEVFNRNGVDVLISRRKSEDEALLYLIPYEDLFDVIGFAHAAVGHKGISQTQTYLTKRCVNITKKAVEIYINGCVECQEKALVLTAKRENSSFCVDLNERSLLGLVDMQVLPDGKFKYILYYQDGARKFLVLRALESNTAREIAETLFEVFLLLGAPYVLQSRQCRLVDLTNVIKELKSIWAECSVVVGTETVAAEDDIGDRVLKMITNWMESRVCSNWHIGINFVQFKINTEHDRNTGIASYEAMFGREALFGLCCCYPQEDIRNLETEDELKCFLENHGQRYARSTISSSSGHRKTGLRCVLGNTPKHWSVKRCFWPCSLTENHLVHSCDLSGEPGQRCSAISSVLREKCAQDISADGNLYGGTRCVFNEFAGKKTCFKEDEQNPHVCEGAHTNKGRQGLCCGQTGTGEVVPNVSLYKKPSSVHEARVCDELPRNLQDNVLINVHPKQAEMRETNELLEKDDTKSQVTGKNKTLNDRPVYMHLGRDCLAAEQGVSILKNYPVVSRETGRPSIFSEESLETGMLHSFEDEGKLTFPEMGREGLAYHRCDVTDAAVLPCGYHHAEKGEKDAGSTCSHQQMVVVDGEPRKNVRDIIMLMESQMCLQANHSTEKAGFSIPSMKNKEKADTDVVAGSFQNPASCPKSSSVDWKLWADTINRKKKQGPPVLPKTKKSLSLKCSIQLPKVEEKAALDSEELACVNTGNCNVVMDKRVLLDIRLSEEILKSISFIDMKSSQMIGPLGDGKGVSVLARSEFKSVLPQRNDTGTMESVKVEIPLVRDGIFQPGTNNVTFHSVDEDSDDGATRQSWNHDEQGLQKALSERGTKMRWLTWYCGASPVYTYEKKVPRTQMQSKENKYGNNSHYNNQYKQHCTKDGDCSKVVTLEENTSTYSMIDHLEPPENTKYCLWCKQQASGKFFCTICQKTIHKVCGILESTDGICRNIYCSFCHLHEQKMKSERTRYKGCTEKMDGKRTVLRGKSFYAMETKPFCESCYINTLEKCSVCSKPITDRLLRATGKPYHPACFTCVVCGKSLDGVPFTVDATNQIHCIEDFHKKFAPRCCICQHPIMPKPGEDETVRFVAMDRSFHVDCYRCEDCGLLLSSELEGRGCYPLDDHILCKNCNAKRIQALTTKMTTEL